MEVFNMLILVMSLSWNFPARAELWRFWAEPNQPELKIFQLELLIASWYVHISAKWQASSWVNTCQFIVKSPSRFISCQKFWCVYNFQGGYLNIKDIAFKLGTKDGIRGNNSLILWMLSSLFLCVKNDSSKDRFL